MYCSSNYMQIELDESRYNMSKYLSVTLRSTSCKVSVSSSKISIGTKLNDCDTIKKAVGSHFIYENQLVLRPKTSGIISRDPDVYITFSCVFATDTFISSSGHDLVKEVNATERKFLFSFKLLMLCMHWNYIVNFHALSRYFHASLCKKRFTFMMRSSTTLQQ